MTPPSTTSSTRPDTKLFLSALISILVKMSATRLKSKGDKGSPCLKPFSGLKYVLFSSWILTHKDPPLTKFHDLANPFLSKTNLPCHRLSRNLISK